MSDNSRTLICKTTGELTGFLEKSRSAVAMALPKHLNPDRMLRLALTCFSTTPKLRECTAHSILSSIVVASQIGLEPGVAGQGYLIPYGQLCTFVPGWQGLVGLLNNSGRATAWTGAVFEGDKFDFQLGSKPKCDHIPGDNYGDPTKLIWVYACGKVNGSEQPVIEAWPVSRVWKHRDKFNKVGAKHYSYEHPEMYARKVVLLQVLKYMPRSIELNNALAATNAAEQGNTTYAEGGVIIEAEATDIPIPKAEVTTLPAPSKKEKKEKPAPATPAADPLVSQADAIFAKLGEMNRTTEELLRVLIGYKMAPADALTVDDIPVQFHARILSSWDAVEVEMAKLTPANAAA